MDEQRRVNVLSLENIDDLDLLDDDVHLKHGSKAHATNFNSRDYILERTPNSTRGIRTRSHGNNWDLRDDIVHMSNTSSMRDDLQKDLRDDIVHMSNANSMRDDLQKDLRDDIVHMSNANSMRDDLQKDLRNDIIELGGVSKHTSAAQDHQTNDERIASSWPRTDSETNHSPISSYDLRKDIMMLSESVKGNTSFSHSRVEPRTHGADKLLDRRSTLTDQPEPEQFKMASSQYNVKRHSTGNEMSLDDDIPAIRRTYDSYRPTRHRSNDSTRKRSRSRSKDSLGSRSRSRERSRSRNRRRLTDPIRCKEVDDKSLDTSAGSSTPVSHFCSKALGDASNRVLEDKTVENHCSFQSGATSATSSEHNETSGAQISRSPSPEHAHAIPESTIKTYSTDPGNKEQKAITPLETSPPETSPSDFHSNILMDQNSPRPNIAQSTQNHIGKEVDKLVERYFVMKIRGMNELEEAERDCMWPTNPVYDEALQHAYEASEAIYLVFTVNLTKEFCGIAKMISKISWFPEKTVFDRSRFRRRMKIQWLGSYNPQLASTQSQGKSNSTNNVSTIDRGMDILDADMKIRDTNEQHSSDVEAISAEREKSNGEMTYADLDSRAVYGLGHVRSETGPIEVELTCPEKASDINDTHISSLDHNSQRHNITSKNSHTPVKEQTGVAVDGPRKEVEIKSCLKDVKADNPHLKAATIKIKDRIQPPPPPLPIQRKVIALPPRPQVPFPTSSRYHDRLMRNDSNNTIHESRHHYHRFSHPNRGRYHSPPPPQTARDTREQKSTPVRSSPPPRSSIHTLKPRTENPIRAPSDPRLPTNTSIGPQAFRSRESV
ncbi:hypothetical protein BGZ46_010264 [Entomortierella lignicola]|nr:hypothetical protein BGZ46_010264 [Entomortierella lignicola]